MSKSIRVRVSVNLSGMIIGVTGSDPYPENEIRQLVISNGGFVGDKDILQQGQPVVIGRLGYDERYLMKTIYLGQRSGQACQYMSQEDFLQRYVLGLPVKYSATDRRFFEHSGLQFTASLNSEWINSTPIKTVHWHILPPGKHPFISVLEHYRLLRELDPQIRIDEERLELLYSLQPDEIYIGLGDFNKYVIFNFVRYNKVVLECPMFGNAIYIISSDWEELSQYTKAELLWYYKRYVTRIVHRGDWFLRLQQALFT